jgi:hypothetical protein
MIASSLKARVTRVAVTMGACPVHGMLLQCVCQWRWAGTEDEWQELVPLVELLSPYFDQIPPSGYRCRCGEQLWCAQCYEGAARQIAVPTDLFTPEEEARYGELLTLMECTSPRPTGIPWEPDDTQTRACPRRLQTQRL